MYSQTIKYIQNLTFLLMNLRLVARITPSITVSYPQILLIITSGQSIVDSNTYKADQYTCL